MWNAVSDKDKNDSDFTGFLVQTDYQAKQTGFIQPYADSPMDHEQVGEEVYISMVNKAEKYCWFMTPYLIITDGHQYPRHTIFIKRSSKSIYIRTIQCSC